MEGAAAERIAELEAELARLAQGEGQGDGELDELRAAATAAESSRAELAAGWPDVEAAAAKAAEAFSRATQVRDAARTEAEKANQRLAALQGDLGAVEAKLARAAMEGSDEVLAGMIETGPGIERALSAALGERLRAAVVGSLGEGVGRLRDSEGASRALVAGSPADAGDPTPPVDGARRLLDLVRADGAAGDVAQRLLHDAWLVDDLEEVPSDFRGIAVTVDGDCFDGSVGELRRLPREGTDPALAARSAREELVSRIAQREQTAERDARELARADEALAKAQAERDSTDLAMRDARRALDEADEEAKRTSWLADRRAERADDGPQTVKRAAARGRAGRRAPPRRGRREGRRGPPPRPGAPAPPDLSSRTRRFRPSTASPPRSDGSPRRSSATPSGSGVHPARAAAARSPPSSASAPKQEYALTTEMREVSEALTAAEIEASQLRDRRDESRTELVRLGSSLERELVPATEDLPAAEREEIGVKLERLVRRREQIGPVNPLAEREYAEAAEHARELKEQRKDIEAALEELKALIRRTDREIAAAFEETFEATARNFEEMVGELFPGGKGKLRRIDAVPSRAVAGANGQVGERAEPDQRRGGGRRLRRPQGRGLGGRDRGHPGRQVHPPPLAPLRWREVAGRPRVRLRRPDGPPVPLLHPRRGRGRARRPQHRPLPPPGPPLLGALPVHRRHPPEAHDGRRRHPLRSQHGRRRHHEGRLTQAPPRPRHQSRETSRRRTQRQPKRPSRASPRSFRSRSTR